MQERLSRMEKELAAAREGKAKAEEGRKGQARANLTFRRKASHATAQAQRPRARKGGNERGEGKDGWSGWKDSDRPTTRTTNPRLQGDLLRGVPENDRY